MRAGGDGVTRGIVISLCDLTGEMVRPWLEADYECVLVDPQHPEGVNRDGNLWKIGHVIDHPVTWRMLRMFMETGRVVAVFGFPVCTQLAVSGTSRWAEKRAADPYFQAKAMALVHECRVIGEMSGAPYFFENPVSAISSIYRKPDCIFSPNEYGGYLPANDNHPLYPEYFPPRDAYKKTTCLWTGNGFLMPEKLPVKIDAEQQDGQGSSKAHNKLGGKSERTKNIRSATPRGFAMAVFLHNAPHLRQPANDNTPAASEAAA
jgi:hypothetical protein